MNLIETVEAMTGKKPTAREAEKFANDQFGRVATWLREQDDKEQTERDQANRKEFSQKRARDWAEFIATGCKGGHTTTVRNAVVKAGWQLKNNVSSDRFNRQEFQLEIDRILVELEIPGDWFWRDM